MPVLSEIWRFLRETVRRNTGTKLLALAIAVVLWWFVAGESKVQMGFVIPLELRNLPRGVAIANKVQREIEVRLAGPPSLIGNLPPSDISAAIDLSDASPGRALYPISAASVKVPAGIAVQRIYPGAVEIDVQPLERRVLPVDARIDQRFRKAIRRVDVVPPEVAVEALAAEFESLRRLQTEEIEPTTESGVFTTNARVDLQEGHAKIVGSPSVRVTVTFRK